MAQETRGTQELEDADSARWGLTVLLRSTRLNVTVDPRPLASKFGSVTYARLEFLIHGLNEALYDYFSVSSSLSLDEVLADASSWMSRGAI